MPQVIGSVTEDTGSIWTYSTGTVTEVTQTFTFSEQQDGMTFVSKGFPSVLLTVNGKTNTIPPYATIKINDEFTSFDVARVTPGSHSFEVTSFKLKHDVNDVDDFGSQLADKASNLLKGKKIVMFGDSITDLGTIPSKVASISGATTYNVGFQACCISPLSNAPGDGKEQFSMYNLAVAINNNDFTTQTNLANTTLPQYAAHLNTLKSIDFNTVDLITIAYGTNDFGFSMPLGSASSDTSDTFGGSLNQIVKLLTQKYPNIKVAFITPFYRDNYFNPNTAGFRLTEYVNMIKNVAARFGKSCIDMFANSGINDYNTTIFLKDGLHPNTTGDALIANVICNGLMYTTAGYDRRDDYRNAERNIGNLISDSEYHAHHHPSNTLAVKNGKTYLRNKSSVRFQWLYLTDAVLHNVLDRTGLKVQGYFLTEQAGGGRVDISLVNSSGTTIAEQTKSLSTTGTEEFVSVIFKCPVGLTLTGTKLVVKVNNMVEGNYVYARDVRIFKDEEIRTSRNLQRNSVGLKNTTGVPALFTANGNANVGIGSDIDKNYFRINGINVNEGQVLAASFPIKQNTNYTIGYWYRFGSDAVGGKNLAMKSNDGTNTSGFITVKNPLTLSTSWQFVEITINTATMTEPYLRLRFDISAGATVFTNNYLDIAELYVAEGERVPLKHEICRDDLYL